MTTQAIQATEDAAAADGTAQATEQASVAGTQASGWTAEELEAVVDRGVAGRLSEFWQALDRRLTPIEQRAATVEQMQQTITEVMGETRQARTLVQKLAEGTLSKEELEATLAGHAERQQREAEKAENAQLKKQLEERRKADEAQQAKAAQGAGARDVLEWEFQHYYSPMVVRMATAQGLAPEDIKDDLPRIREGATQKDWDRWLDQAQKVIDTKADKRLKAEQARPDVPATRPSAAAEQPRSNYERLRRYYERNPNG